MRGEHFQSFGLGNNIVVFELQAKISRYKKISENIIKVLEWSCCSFVGLKLVSAIFYQIPIFHQMIPFKNYEKCLLVHLKSSFRSGNLPLFFSQSANALEVVRR